MDRKGDLLVKKGGTVRARVLAALKRGTSTPPICSCHVPLALRTTFAALAALFALAAPASASEVFQYRDGELIPRELPYLAPPAGPEAALLGSEQACPAPPPPAPALPKLRARAAGGQSVRGAIARARRGNRISAAEAGAYRSAYAAARRTRGRLGGRNRRELASVIAVLEGIAGRGKLTSGRMPALFLQLRRNSEFWGGTPRFPPRPDAAPDPCTRPPSNSPAGARIVFEGSRIVFQYYPGQGLQLQPLANFGMVNGMITACRRTPEECDRTALKQLVDELVDVRSSRGGFTTWEYWFHFGGGVPPWTSGISQGTALQALARASEQSILNDKSYLRVAHGALGAFRKAPPTGLRVRSGRGSHYLIYSFDPNLRVLNAFLQAIIGLYDYGRIAEDRVARSLFKAGDRGARRELRRYDTGKWSLYSLGGAEASLSYHRLASTFLGELCQRVKGRYCTYRQRFIRYLGASPVIKYSGAQSGAPGQPLSLRYRISEASCVTAEVTSSTGDVVFRERRKVARGTHRFRWTPEAPGTYTLSLEAVDQNKLKTTVDVTLEVQ
jgi:hypothetical protein